MSKSKSKPYKPYKTKDWPTKRDRLIKSCLRKVWWYSPQRKAVKARAWTSWGRRYNCEKCRELVKRIYVDHIEPVEPVQPPRRKPSWAESLKRFIQRLFVGEEWLQALCKVCHYEKSRKENEKRKEKEKLHDPKRSR